MGAYILRRLLLIIPTLLGIMVINFTLVQFVPGGPIEQIIAQVQGQGDVFESAAVAALVRKVFVVIGVGAQAGRWTSRARTGCRRSCAAAWSCARSPQSAR